MGKFVLIKFEIFPLLIYHTLFPAFRAAHIYQPLDKNNLHLLLLPPIPTSFSSSCSMIEYKELSRPISDASFDLGDKPQLTLIA